MKKMFILLLLSYSFSQSAFDKYNLHIEKKILGIWNVENSVNKKKFEFINRDVIVTINNEKIIEANFLIVNNDKTLQIFHPTIIRYNKRYTIRFINYNRIELIYDDIVEILVRLEN